VQRQSTIQTASHRSIYVITTSYYAQFEFFDES